VGLIAGYCMERLGVCPLKLIVHHSIDTERSIPDKASVHNVPLDDTLMVAADDFLLPELALALALGLVPDALLEALLATVICPEISENKNEEQVCGEPVSMTVHGRDYGGGLDEHVHCWKVGKE
jgi:hypothetical protein